MAPKQSRPVSGGPGRPTRRLKKEATLNVDDLFAQAEVLKHKVVPVEWFVDGDLLENLAAENVENFQKLLSPFRPVAPSGERTWGTMCSCSEGTHYVIKAMEKAYLAVNISCRLRQVFACEILEDRRIWIHKVINAKSDPGDWICIFEDILKMGGDEAYCWVHKKKCKIKPADIVFVGTSCKDFSRQNCNAGRRESIFSQQDTKGGSAQTFRGFMLYCDYHTPFILFYENVTEVDSESIEDVVSENDFDILMAEFSSRNYEGKRFVVDAQFFALPARRRRLVVLFIRIIATPSASFELRPCNTMFETMGNLVRLCQRAPPCLRDVLYRDDHPAVEKELTRRLGEGTPTGKTSTDWADSHMRLYRSKGLRWGTSLLNEATQSSPWIRFVLPRERECAEFSMETKPEAFARDLSQSIDRVSHSSRHEFSQDHVAPTQLPKQQIWLDWASHPSAGKVVPRLLLGQEALLLQGFPVAKATGPVSTTQEMTMQQLAGNMFSLPVVLGVTQAAFSLLFHGATPQLRSAHHLPTRTPARHMNSQNPC